MAFIVCIGMDVAVVVRRRGVTIEAASALAVLEDHDFTCEVIRMVQDTLYETAYEIAVGATAVFPLGIDLYQNHVVRCDQTLSPAQRDSVLDR